jgi:glucokinase
MASNEWTIGVDLGASTTKCGLISPDNVITARVQWETHPADGATVAADRIAERVRQLITQVPRDAPVTRVGVCSPGPLDHASGMIFDPPNLTGWRDVPFAAMLSERLNLPVRLEHDAKASALGEFHFGAGRGVNDMALIIVGTGIGAAIILNGELLRGPTNSAGEVGHITVDMNGPICTCGSNGCVETYACGPAIMRAYSYSTRRAVDSAEQVARAAEQGDLIAQRVFKDAGRALGACVATMAMTLDISTFVMFGSVVKAGELLLAPARAAVPKYSFNSVSQRVRILIGELGNDAGILGAAWAAKEIEGGPRTND